MSDKLSKMEEYSMNDKYKNLENEYKSTVKELADITGWTNQQSEKVLADRKSVV